MRPSGTEPVVRVTGEGENLSLVEEVVDGIVEALLLWAIDTSGQVTLIAARSKKPLAEWSLSEYIYGAEQLGLIASDTATLGEEFDGAR